MPKSLEALTIGEISGVDHPAHLEEGWMVMKATNPEAVQMVEIVEDLVDAVSKAGALDPDLLAQVGTEVLDEQSRAVLKALGTTLAKEAADMPDTFDISTLPEEAQAAFASLTEQVASLSEQVTKAQTEGKTPEQVEAEEVAKALDGMPAALRKAWADQQAELAEATAVAKAEREIRLDAEYLAKAKSLPLVGEDRKDLADVLKALNAFDTDLAEKVEKYLRAANAQIEEGNLFKAAGAPAAVIETGSAHERLDAIAKSIATEESISYPEALQKATEQNPDLYAAHRAESSNVTTEV